ncbi:MAG: D-alanyl-D-alanine carboxypeptidase [Clostridia bacterium]|nr:D-alanyl-D-alanine carboxypeptidase [Clostridia bacterium]
MKIKKQILITLMIISIFISTLIYTNPVQATNSTATNSTSPTPNFTVSAEGAILIDSKTGKVLYGKNENEKLYPASTTKILTAILAIEHCNPTDKITASYDAVMSLPSGYANAAIQPGETLTFQELLDMFLIHSANEIGTILAEHISGSVENFAILMNQKVASLGCKNTHFTNPSGIHDVEHYSTPYDMSLIAQYCMKNETFRNTVSKVSCTIEPTDKYERRYFRNTNELINPSSNYYYEYAIGTKTGYTSQAKRCLIATASKDNLELITVILGDQPTMDDSRYRDTIKMFEYGFSNYKTQQIATKNNIIEEIIVDGATKDTENLSLLLKDDLIALMPKNMTSANLNPTIKLNELIEAPVSEGTVLGKITYTIEGIEYSSDLIASHSVEAFDLKTTLMQIALALFVLFILSKMFLSKKKTKKRNYKNKKYNSKKRMNYKKSNDSIYKF